MTRWFSPIAIPVPSPETLAMRPLLALLERGLLPDALVRAGIRRLCAARLAAESAGGPAGIEARKRQLMAQLARGPIAVDAGAANRQHYEIPAELFRRILGPRLKYSSAYWPAGVETLAAAEEAMLALSTTRAGVADGQEILDLGCGWGSFSLWAAERFPCSRLLAVSNSASQRQFITAEAERRGLTNLEVVTRDVNELAAEDLRGRRFDRIVSIEMLEHVRNHPALFARFASWLAPAGRLFVHVFCHREVAYPFEVHGASDWMAEHFFTGGLMPSADWLPRTAAPLELEERWLLSGVHYQKTAAAWLANLDRERRAAAPILAAVYGETEVRRWLARWRVFFLACAELFGFAGGSEWQVAHYLFRIP